MLVDVLLDAYLEQFPFKCQTVLGFAATMQCNCRKRFLPTFHQIKSNFTKTNCSHMFSCASHQLQHAHVIALSLDWLTVFSVPFVIDQSDNFELVLFSQMKTDF